MGIAPLLVGECTGGSTGMPKRATLGSGTAKRIAGMRDYAMNVAASRKRIICALESYGRRNRRARGARAAGRAISEILAVSMLEALKG